jgi:CHAT domain-containing protein
MHASSPWRRSLGCALLALGLAKLAHPFYWAPYVLMGNRL